MDTTLGDRYIDAIANLDREALLATLAPDATMCALLPRRVREAVNAEEVATAVFDWFGDATEIVVKERRAGAVGERLALSYRAVVTKDEIRYDIEQNGYGWVEHDRIARMHLLCSGFHPIAAAGALQ